MFIAITGGIGSGKSYVCRLLEERGIKVYDCDKAAKYLMRTDRQLQQQLSLTVGQEVFPDGQLDKALLSRYIVASEENALKVDEVVHPAVARHFKASGCEWLESAILFESGFYARVPFDYVICVTAPLEVRIERVMQRDSITHERALEWIGRQMSQEEKASRSDFVIYNDGTTDLRQQIDTIIETIIKTKNKKTKMETILAISGKPGLFRLVSQGNRSLIVETLDAQRRRMPAFATDRITSLADIAMFTEDEDIALWKVLQALGAKEESKVCSLNYKKCSAEELHAYFSEVLPSWDQDRVRDSDIKKLIQWYNILVENGITDFEETLCRKDEDAAEE